ncbi:MAG: chorismate-binding protein, partial [Thaumarchaeota archaeon]|nr:chorismate-binding protein [Nitrososphaerota archaeon]
VRYWERLPSRTEDDLALPDMEFGIYTDGIVFDHINRETHYYTLGENRAETVHALLRRRVGHGGLSASAPRPSVGEAKFESMVEAAKEHITAGDIFQVVLSKRYDFRLSGDLTRFYAALSAINPSPYMYFLKFGARQVVGSSPEMLARVEDRRVETFPIAGTRPHVADRRE